MKGISGLEIGCQFSLAQSLEIAYLSLVGEQHLISSASREIGHQSFLPVKSAGYKV
jgi:hypothetical protein